jgi:DNA anti-recombination protein RmuC
MTAVNDQHGSLDTESLEAADQSGPEQTPGAGNLEKVRDILFGSQMREVDRRFLRLEERLIKETRDLKEEIMARLEALEAYVRNEADDLGGQVRKEQAERIDSHARLAREIAETASGFERRSAALDEQLARGQREIRQLLLEQQQRFSAELRTKTDEVLTALARETHELRADKTDRRALAAMLNELALRLTDELTLPGDGNRGNG